MMGLYCATHFEHLIHAFFFLVWQPAFTYNRKLVVLCCKLWHSRAVSQAGADEAVPVSLTDYARRRLCHDFHRPLNSLGMDRICGDLQRVSHICRRDSSVSGGSVTVSLSQLISSS